MQNKSILILLASLFFFSSCNKPQKIEIKDENGRLSETYFLSKDSLKTGLATTFFVETGKVYMEVPFEKGKEHGESKIYYPSGKIQESSTYTNGVYHGPSKTFYEGGQLKSVVEFIHNSMEGTWITYYPDGQVKEEVTFHESAENGPFVEYYPNGQLKAKGSYLNGSNEHGLLELYDEKGILIKKMDCKMGRCNTIWKKGDVKSESNAI